MSFQNLRSLRDLSIAFCIGVPLDWVTASNLLLALPLQTRLQLLKFFTGLKSSALDPTRDLQPASIEHEGLELMEAILQGDKFMDIKSVEIVVYGMTTYRLFEARDIEARILEVVQWKLPSVTAKGLVSVRFGGYVRFIAYSAIQRYFLVP